MLDEDTALATNDEGLKKGDQIGLLEVCREFTDTGKHGDSIRVVNLPFMKRISDGSDLV